MLRADAEEHYLAGVHLDGHHGGAAGHQVFQRIQPLALTLVLG
jgi:hypothetical protein